MSCRPISIRTWRRNLLTGDWGVRNILGHWLWILQRKENTILMCTFIQIVCLEKGLSVQTLLGVHTSHAFIIRHLHMLRIPAPFRLTHRPDKFMVDFLRCQWCFEIGSCVVLLFSVLLIREYVHLRRHRDCASQLLRLQRLRFGPRCLERAPVLIISLIMT